MLDITPKQLEAVISKYLTKHSSRRFNFLYWNIYNNKNNTLSFVNLFGKELNRINNNNLVYRLIKVIRDDEWNIIHTFINEYITHDNNIDVFVIRLDYLMSYLKSIRYDLSLFKIDYDEYNIGYSNIDDKDNRKPISVVDDDIQSLFLIKRLFNKYYQFIGDISNISDINITNILERYLLSSEFKYEVISDEYKVLIPTTDALDIVAKKFINENSKQTNVELFQIYQLGNLSTVLNKFICADMIIITVRAYIQILLKQLSRKKR